MRGIFLLSLMAVLSLGLIPVSAGAAGDNKVVYHINLGNEQATDALRNIKNHLAVDPKAKIVVVTHSAGIDFLLEGAEDKNGNPYSGPVAALAARQQSDTQQNLGASNGADEICCILLAAEPVLHLGRGFRAHEFGKDVGVEQDTAHAQSFGARVNRAARRFGIGRSSALRPAKRR